jgi:exodeoxyribonuclease VII large subunit
MTAVLSVSEVAQLIGLALDALTPGPLWVEGEIHGLRRPPGGHVWFDLVEPAELGGPPTARLGLVLFSRQRQAVNAQLATTGGVRMTDGTAVRIRGRLDFYAPQGRVQLVMDGIDPAYTLGRLALARQQVLAKLATAGLLEANSRRALPLVPLRVGLVTAADSAAFADVTHELTRSGLAFHVLAADARVQGRDAESSIVAALATLARRAVDVIVVVRGGGARSDLAAFDSERVARAIALCEVPVLTGVGHETDRSVADEVAHTAHKTPTACAAALVDHVRAFLARLDGSRGAIAASSAVALERAQRRLAQRAEGVDQCSRRVLRHADQRIEVLARQVDTLDPARLLARGWSITHTSTGTLARTVDLGVGTHLVTTLADGRVPSIVTDEASIVTDEASIETQEASPDA